MRGDEDEVQDHVRHHRRDRRREAELGAPGAPEDHHHRQVQARRGRSRSPAGRPPGRRGRSPGAARSRTIHRDSSHRPARRECEHGGEPGEDRRVHPAGLVVVADRIGERRPGELQPAHEHLHPLGELDGERVQADLGEADRAGDDDAVDEVERVERELGRHRRQPEAEHAPQEGAVGDQREPAALAPQHPHRDRGSGPVGPEEDAARPLPLDHDQEHRERDRDQDVDDGDAEVGLRPLVEAQQGERVLVERLGPQAEDREARQAGVLVAEQRLRDRPGDGKQDRGRRSSRPRRGRRTRWPPPQASARSAGSRSAGSPR